ncbi:aconitate hydratase AcnA [Kitasatospora sp. MAP5-34]|uniref:aconitate hydratase AcnA n=1 Tax=Kitasatospora sp. MAP5-34 TaxID=3035102 RepID=UPI00247479B9|nr:aconitate hydratase AcnA [Kitasatospora sp. MAP5-34]MDH6578814.1 aconitate hydratase [Kitasatospora sp. MAP5-34]
MTSIQPQPQPSQSRSGGQTDVSRYNLTEIAAAAGVDLATLPYVARILLENTAHLAAVGRCGPELVPTVARWSADGGRAEDLPFQPSRVVLQDYSGIPVLLDLAALRAAAVRRGISADQVNPVLPAHLVVDHTVRVDASGRDALRTNTNLEFARNGERYALLRWAGQAFSQLRIVPPGKGIIHQINLERLAQVAVVTEGEDGRPFARPDTVLGTDSHTSMVGALGVLGWGVGGIEATSVLLGEPVLLAPPRVIGVRLTGRLRPGVTATDLVLTITQFLRSLGVLGAILEFHGEGVASLAVHDRATVANMAPDYGATTAFFPVDDETLRYLRSTGRSAEQVELVERYCRAQQLFHQPDAVSAIRYSETVTFDLATVEPCVAGPHRPDQRVPLAEVPDSLARARGPVATATRTRDGAPADGSVLLAALTSCTNTSHPDSMVIAGLVAKRAVEFGLRVPEWTKTSLAPGSRTVPEYLDRAGLLDPLKKLGFDVVAFGCTTCHGNSGPLTPEAARAVTEDGILGAAVLSGNRNFEGRLHPQIRAAYLASPGLVVAYALAGTVTKDLVSEPVGTADDGREVYLRDLWPEPAEVAAAVRTSVGPELYASAYADLFSGDERWQSLPAPVGELYTWEAESSYILEPPYVDTPSTGPAPAELTGARILALLGDSVSTDHISPVGAITPDGDAGRFLSRLGIDEPEFNSYGSRRGNHHVMLRGTFASPRLRNAMADGRVGPWTRHRPSGELLSIHAAAELYRASDVPLVVVAGREYGCGSARDWAAKGTALLGVRAVLAESFERIHRSNLVGMGVLPLRFPKGRSSADYGLDGSEEIDLSGLSSLRPHGGVLVRIRRADGSSVTFTATAAVETAREVEYLGAGGVLPFIRDGLVPASAPGRAE